MILLGHGLTVPVGDTSGFDGVSALADGSAQRLGDPGRDLLLFEGAFHPDTGVRAEDALEAFRRHAPDAWWRQARGRYCGVYVSARQPARVFADHAGIHDIYMWQEGTSWAVSNSLGRLLALLPPHARQLDEQAAAEFLTLGMVLNGRTFARDVRRLPPGSHFCMLPTPRAAPRAAPPAAPCGTPIWRYELKAPPGTMDQAVDEYWEVLRRAASRIRQIAGPSAAAKLGLSGGLDSRLTAALLADAGMNVQPYFFGESRSDAASVASAVADRLGLKLSFTNHSREFPRLFRRSMEHNPMADLEWCKYLTGRAEIAPPDVLLSGHLGDFLFGEWSFRASHGPEGNSELAHGLMANCQLERPTAETAERVLAGLGQQLDAIGGSVLQRKQGLWFYGVNMAIKNCGLFHQFGEVPHYSLFEDIDVINAGLAVGHRWRLRNRFYRLLFARHLPDLDPARIRLENGSNDHKPLESWLLHNSCFISAVREIADFDEWLGIPGREQTVGEAALAIFKGGVNRAGIHQFFRYLTVRAYRHAYG